MIPAQCKKAHALLNLSIYDLGHLSGVPFGTIKLFEEGQLPAEPQIARKLRTALESSGITFSTIDCERTAKARRRKDVE